MLLVLHLNIFYEYSAAVWCGILCVNILYSNYTLYDVKYRILEIKEYFMHLFILLMRVINMNIFKVHICLLGLIVIFPLCSASYGRSVTCLVRVVRRWTCLCDMLFVFGLETSPSLICVLVGTAHAVKFVYAAVVIFVASLLFWL